MEFTKSLKSRIVPALFVIFLIIGVFIRIWKLDKVPIELFGDELDVGLQAYSVLTTGKDYLGNKLPILFHSFSEYRLPMQLYLDVPFIKLFGLNEIGVRSVSVLMGFLSLVLFYFLVKELFSGKLAIIATLFLMISPWHINFSRQANDAGILLPFIIGGTLFFIKGLKNYRYLYLSAIFFSLSVYAYAIATLFTPLFVIALMVIFRKEIIKYSYHKLFFVGLVGIIILIPYLNFTLKGLTRERFSYISAISEDRLISEVVDKRRWSQSLQTRFFYNKKTVAIEIVMKNYLRAISPTFLFSEGDPNMRQGIEGFGQMYHYEIVLVFLGIVFALTKLSKNEQKKNYLLAILFWLLFAPIPSALTRDGGYHSSRLILTLPPLIIISAMGFKVLINTMWNKKGRILLVIFIGVMLLDISRFLHRYFVIWPNESWRFWQSGYKTTLSYVKQVDGDYEKILFNNTYEPMLPRFLFYYNYDMGLFQKQFQGDKHIENKVKGIDGFSLGNKYYFGELKKPLEDLADERSLVVASGANDVTNPLIFKEGNLKLLNVVNSPTKIPIFYIFTSNFTSN
ncbi:hypothetical protein A2955_04040 [Candidatus Woesebacteria bacterium RIFCSPLOWO2_01_FULL_37_19]|uniref:Glycosyltransferase RgtA/B/C/D-like domain-containing protein n=2 Tax=Candidatus Woeseibacteriota TaxID=1752722 RepID=A0A1F8B9Y5_9BACT|nr:MAG: hypothetical protein A2771_02810 [Candidatus Woesebacteria bacterium RIFCSPHIGHO2_01_FULL_38_26b]OGM60205.1 MAG: hypothetical protein A2955_04040 [Candidatus Woesebacteria bacterium RIFCSPLOWO2_01_FULL_37_19]